MAEFSIRNPFFIIVVCLVLLVIGSTSLVRMPVDLFPSINLPEVVVESPRPPQRRSGCESGIGLNREAAFRSWLRL